MSQSVDRLTRLLVTQAGEEAVVRAQGPVRLSRYSEPEPDVTLLMPRDDDRATAKPGPADTLVVIEVSDSSLALDRGPKALLYARAGVVEYWVVSVRHETLEVFTEPSADGYGSVVAHHRGATLSAGLLPRVVVAVDAIFGAA